MRERATVISCWFSTGNFWGYGKFRRPGRRAVREETICETGKVAKKEARGPGKRTISILDHR
jgi:hypothetical protein